MSYTKQSRSGFSIKAGYVFTRIFTLNNFIYIFKQMAMILPRQDHKHASFRRKATTTFIYKSGPLSTVTNGIKPHCNDLPWSEVMMEHRWDKRIRKPMKVTVHTGWGISLRSLARNLSRGGVYLEMKEPGNLRKTVVQVEFNEEKFSEVVPALVLRYTENAAALMFISHSPQLRSFLKHLVS